MIEKKICIFPRTEYAKEYRRIHGDRGGCRFADRYFDISDNPWANTISTVTKDNLICEKFS